MYNVDVTKPFPYRDNPRSLTLLAYLNEVGRSSQSRAGRRVDLG